MLEERTEFLDKQHFVTKYENESQPLQAIFSGAKGGHKWLIEEPPPPSGCVTPLVDVNVSGREGRFFSGNFRKTQSSIEF